MKIAVASDHAGFLLKEAIKAHLTDLGYTVQDFGTRSEDSVDYPLFIRPAAEAVGRGEYDLGVVFGGSGNGEAIVANKVAGVRCAVIWNDASARYARAHNDANVVAIGQRLVTADVARSAVDAWLGATFEGGRHARRVRQIAAVEEAWCDQ
ncbi:MAG: ribose 5-phosphate isomerase B [Anaerolineae bacterium]|nr:ribose 5-phosphate isomerase B [Anaerolineae bacterium]